MDGLDGVMLYISIFMLFVILLFWLGFSLVSHETNVAIGSVCIVIGICTAAYTVAARPRILFVPLGVVSILAWFAVGAFNATDISEEKGEAPYHLEENIFCRQKGYGFVTSDSGEETEVFKRFLLFDFRIANQSHSDIYGNNWPDLSPEKQEIVNRCQRAYLH